MPKSVQNYTMLLLALLGMGLVGIWLKETTLSTGIFLAVGYMEARVIGQTLFPDFSPGKQVLLGASLLVFGTLLAAGCVYFFWRLGPAEAAVLWLVTGLACAVLHHRKGPDDPAYASTIWRADTRQPIAFLLALAAIGLDVIGAALLVRSATVEAIRSPWEVVPGLFFVCFGVASLALVALASLGARRLTVMVCLLHATIAISVATIVYPLGYGFDGFIHARTEQMIVEDGVVLPKTPYYTGQYALIAYTAHLTHLPANAIDRLLGPLAFIGFPILAFWVALAARKKNEPLPLLALLFPLLLPFGAFVTTTPLGLALSAAIATLAALTSLPGNRRALFVAFLGAGAAACIHPMVGIPLFGAVLLLLPARRGARPLVGLGASVCGLAVIVAGVPAAFAVNALLGSNVQVGFSPAIDIRGLQEALTLALPRLWLSGGAWLDTLTYWSVAALLLPVAGTIACIALRSSLWQRFAIRSLVLSAGLVASFLILGMMRFSLGGDTGSAAFPFRARMLELAGLFLFPTAVAGWSALLARVRPYPHLGTAIGLGVAVAMTATLAVSYPRADRLETSKGYNVSAATFHAIDAILERAPEHYIVLGNQTLAAAAIERAGFPRYYRGNFYVSHASAAPDLETFFLQMNHTPSQAVAEQAMQFAGVDTLYFVVHDYWKNSRLISEQAQKAADDAFSIDGGKVRVFLFKKQS